MKRNPYLGAVETILQHLEEEEEKSILKAAEMVVESLSSGGVLYCSEIGHGIHSDWISRAGGLFAIRPFSFRVAIDDKASAVVMEGRKPAARVEADIENVRHAVKVSRLLRGDVMLIGSVSGRNRAPVELALACRSIGVKTIGFTSVEYSSRVPSLHPSGQRLRDVVDVVVDNGAPYGDAAVNLEGYEAPVMPVSGCACLVAGWMLLGRVLETMARRKTPATVYMSANREGGEEFNRKQQEAYDRKGY